MTMQEIALADDADDLSVGCHDGQPADPLLGHEGGNVVHRRLRTN